MSVAPLVESIALARSVLSNVTKEQFEAPTPCASWDVRGLVNHLIGAQQFFFAGMTGGEMPAQDDDPAGGDFLATFDERSAQVLGAFQEDGAMQKMVNLPFGSFPGAAFFGMACTDTFQHAWDLAKATGQDTNLNPALATQLLEQSKASIQDAFRGPEGAPFGVEQQAPAGASPADQLAAFLGRTV